MFFQQSPSADKYLISVTAGPTYDPSTHVPVPVNKPETIKLSSEFADIELNVRVKGYRGLPRNSPSTSEYFEEGSHATDGDQYSLCFRFTPKRPSPKHSGSPEHENEREGEEIKSGNDVERISGEDLQFGNDFDKPVREYLPPGFNTALNILKWWIDPGLEGDAYSDTPNLFGPALSSFNTVYCGRGTYDPSIGLMFSEGGDEEGMKMRDVIGVPGKGKDRMKWALTSGNKEKWRWEYGRTYGLDFFNPYIDFQAFKVKLPGFQVGVLRYWDGQSLRYVLRNKRTKDIYLVVVFSLYLKEDLEEDGSLKLPEAEAKARAATAGPRDLPGDEEEVDSKIPKEDGTSLDDVD
ncbi:uncharacterized protein DNG_04738 [Cephalotrichum gorgonifer]|uniref:Domain of unknown function at the cortex 1 domain-containing protein n=1 Tax=Cephalotrichum gorgonifer TaxID=2041049 RepID=A0AAE8MZA6_9PEZI|nr:uncharacterized protein DNG_04738 [Cephalotrichum gorgonifer]